MYKKLLAGKLQGGKTTRAIQIFQQWLDEPATLPTFATFDRKAVLADLMYKFKLADVDTSTLLIPNQHKREFNRLKDTIFDGVEVPRGIGLIGLHNKYWHDRIASSILHYHQPTKMMLDEYDTGQVGFDEEFMIQIKRDQQIQSYLIRDVLDELCLISATNLQGAITKMHFDEVEMIQPADGYSDEYQFVPMDAEEIDSLLRGTPTAYVKNRVAEAQGNVMFNLDKHIVAHEQIARTFEEFAEKTHVVNSESDFNPMCLLSDEKQIVVGGDMFARGQTFHGVTDLFIHKPGSHMAVYLQAVGRLFGYGKGKLRLMATQEEGDKIKRLFEVNNRVSTQDFLMLPYKERWKRIAQMTLPKDIHVLNPSKTNGFGEVKSNAVMSNPVFTFPQEPTDQSNITMLQTKHSGTLPKARTKGFTMRWGENPEHMQSALVDSHPFGHAQENWGHGGPRLYIVPPQTTVYGDKGAAHLDYAEPETEHWWIENLYRDEAARRAIDTEYVGTYDSDGNVRIWKNSNGLNLEEHECKRIVRKS